MNNQGAYKASVSTIDLSPSGKLIAAGYDDGTIRQVPKIFIGRILLGKLNSWIFWIFHSDQFNFNLKS